MDHTKLKRHIVNSFSNWQVHQLISAQVSYQGPCTMLINSYESSFRQPSAYEPGPAQCWHNPALHGNKEGQITLAWPIKINNAVRAMQLYTLLTRFHQTASGTPAKFPYKSCTFQSQAVTCAAWRLQDSSTCSNLPGGSCPCGDAVQIPQRHAGPAQVSFCHCMCPVNIWCSQGSFCCVPPRAVPLAPAGWHLLVTGSQ